MLVLKNADLLLKSFEVSFANLIDLYIHTLLLRNSKRKKRVRGITKPPEKIAYVSVKS